MPPKVSRAAFVMVVVSSALSSSLSFTGFDFFHSLGLLWTETVESALLPLFFDDEVVAGRAFDDARVVGMRVAEDVVRSEVRQKGETSGSDNEK